VAAKVLNRKFIGVDIQPKYCRISNSRIGNVSLKDIFEDKPRDALF
jgi:DNA modification methylase